MRTGSQGILWCLMMVGILGLCQIGEQKGAAVYYSQCRAARARGGLFGTKPKVTGRYRWDGVFMSL